MKSNTLAAGLLLLALAACALAPKESGKAYMFALGQAKVPKHATHAGSLTVALPAAAPELNTYRIALLKNGKTWDYYAGARWAEFLPVLVQDGLIKSFEGAALFETVVTDQTTTAPDWIAKASIRSFQAEYAPNREAPDVRIRIVAGLYRYPAQTATASFEASATARAASDSLPAIQDAFQIAFVQVQKELVRKAGRYLDQSRLDR